MSVPQQPTNLAEDRPLPKTISTGRKWLIAATVMFGAFLSVMDVTVVNVALPHMMGSFGQTLSAITWVATSYSIAEIIMITMAGWWSTLLGRKRFYLGSITLFTVGSILAGTARTFPEILIFRSLQGIGGGGLIPVSQAILRETFPAEEQGMAMSIFGMGVVLAPALGPVVGGWLTDQYGWPWIFYINVPFSILGIFMVSLFVEDPLYLRRGLKQVDWIGIGLLTVGLTTMQVVLERGQENNWFESGWITAGAVVTAFALLGLIFSDLRSREPVVNFRLLRDVPLSAGCSMGLIFGITFYGTTFSLPALLQNLLGYPAYEAGLVLLPRGVSLLLLLPVVGWLYNKVDPRILLLTGIALVYWAYEKIAHLSADVDFWTIALPLMIMGAGMPFMFVTMTTVSLSTTKPKDMTTASGLYTLGRRVGGNIGYALTATLVDRRSTFHRARLVERITHLNPTFGGLHAGLSAQMIHRGFDPATAQSKALALIQRLVNREATMMAYNDVSWVFGVMLVAILPLIFLFPGRRSKTRGIKEVPL